MNALDFLYIPLAVITAPWWAFKRRAGWRERFGHVQDGRIGRGGVEIGTAGQGGKKEEGRRLRILLHAVSVGEVAALRGLVPRLTGAAEVVISVTTDTGMARACALFGATCAIVRYPLDFSWAVDRFLDAVSPDVVGLVELEVWPNFVASAKRRGIGIGVINGRLSERSAVGYGRVKWFFGRTLAKLDFVGVQDESYLKRFVGLGARPEVCSVMGTMKWDAATIQDGHAGAAAIGASMGIDPARPVLVAGSTGPTEEALLHLACPLGVQLVCAPRRPERFEEAAAAMGGGPGNEQVVVRRSACVAGGARAAEGRTRFLLDTIGELSAAYALATVVVMGRSFNDQHGSDPIEPVAFGKATVIGPAVADFANVVVPLVEAGGLVQCSKESLSGVLRELFGDAARREELGRRGRACIRGYQGASERYAAVLLKEGRREAARRGS